MYMDSELGQVEEGRSVNWAQQEASRLTRKQTTGATSQGWDENAADPLLRGQTEQFTSQERLFTLLLNRFPARVRRWLGVGCRLMDEPLTSSPALVLTRRKNTHGATRDLQNIMCGSKINIIRFQCGRAGQKESWRFGIHHQKFRASLAEKSSYVR